MKTISVPLEVKNKLDIFADGKSINKAMRELLDDVDCSNNNEEFLGNININMDDDLFMKLKNCRIYPTEPYASVILRLLSNLE